MFTNIIFAQPNHRYRRFIRRSAIHWQAMFLQGSTVAVALTLAALNPLACALHCHIGLLIASADGSIAVADERSLFLCNYHADAAADAAPTPLDQRLMRALLEIAPPLSGLALPTPDLIAALESVRSPDCAANAPAPPAPPPRLAI